MGARPACRQPGRIYGAGSTAFAGSTASTISGSSGGTSQERGRGLVEATYTASVAATDATYAAGPGSPPRITQQVVHAAAPAAREAIRLSPEMAKRDTAPQSVAAPVGAP